MKTIFLTIAFLGLVLFSNAQPSKSFFVVHCDPNESYNFPNLEVLVDSANAYNIKLTIEFTSFWVDSILSHQSRKNKLIIWQSQGHEIGMHHHEITAPGIWDGYCNLPMIEIHNAGRDTNDFIGTVDSLYNYIQQVTTTPIKTAGVEDSLELPTQCLFQTKGKSQSDGYSNPLSFNLHGNNYCRTTHCYINTVFKEKQLENQYPSMTGFDIIGANTHVYSFVSEPMAIINYFKFINLKGISSNTISDLLQNCNTVGMNDADYKSLVIYPNPSRGKIIINANNIKQVTIFNANGQLVLQSESNVLNISNQPNGVYFIRVVLDDIVVTQRIIKI